MSKPDIYRRMANLRARFKENPQRSISEEYYRWKIEYNPFGMGHISIETRRNTDVGSATVTPKKLYVQGEFRLSSEIGDTFTLPDFRRQGIFSKCVNECREYSVKNGQAIIYGTPNAQSLPGCEKKLGFPPCPHAKIVRMGKYSKPVFNEHEEPRRRFMDFLIRKRPLPCNDGTTIRPLDRLSENADGLWGRDRFVFAVVRNWEYIQWRYLANPDSYELLGAFREDQCAGYMVLKRTRNGRTGFLCDFISLDDDANVFNHLLAAAEKYFKTWDVDRVQLLVVKGSIYFRELFKAGYFVTQENVPVIVYGGTDAGRDLLKYEGPWHFTFGDTDFA